MMVVVTLNRLVLEHAVTQVLERVQSAVRDFDAAADKVQVRAGGVLAQEVRDCGLAMREEFAKNVRRTPSECTGKSVREARRVHETDSAEVARYCGRLRAGAVWSRLLGWRHAALSNSLLGDNQIHANVLILVRRSSAEGAARLRSCLRPAPLRRVPVMIRPFRYSPFVRLVRYTDSRGEVDHGDRRGSEWAAAQHGCPRRQQL